MSNVPWYDYALGVTVAAAAVAMLVGAVVAAVVEWRERRRP